ncbi:HYR domain-containing protein, partial [Flavobacteriaceae bacterium LMO-SS05]
MDKFTQIKTNWNPFYCSSLFKNLKKSITGLAVLILFLFGTNVQAQVVPCIDGNSTEWGSAALQLEPTFDYHADVFTGNQDDIFTASKDFKLFGGYGQPYNGWTLSPMQAKSDIMNAAAVILTGLVTDPEDGCISSFGAYDPSHTYLFFAGDRESNNGTGYIGFWFLKNGTSPITDADGHKIFSPARGIGDLLVLADFTSGGRDADVTVLQWVGPGNGTEGNNNSLVKITTNAQVGQNNATQTPVPAGFAVPAGQTTYDYNEFYEGVIDLTSVFDLQTNPELICSATWMLETRASAEITADLKDYVAGSFHLTPTIEVSDDTVCEGGAASLTATVKQGNMVIEDPVSDGYTFVWSGPGTFSGQGTATITFDPAELSDAGNYSVAVMSPNNCQPDGGDAEGTLTVKALPEVTADNASVACDETSVQLTASPSGGTWSGDHVNATGLFDATGLAAGQYNVTYTYTNSNGCTNSDDAVVTVEVDDLPPTIDCAADKNIECDAEIVWDAPSASDNCSEPTVTVLSTVEDLDECGLGTITRTWQAEDGVGLTATCSQIITIEDSTAPTLNVPDDIRFECVMGDAGTATASDNCDNDPEVSYTDAGQLDECGLGTITRTWKAVDCAGLETTGDQIITIYDETAP